MKRQRRYQRKELVDRETGESYAVPVLVGDRAVWKEPYTVVFQDASARLAKLAVEKPLRPITLVVAFHLIGKCSWDNYLHLTQAQIAVDLGVSTSQVSRGMQQLLDIGILLRGPKTGGNTYAYRLNSAFAYRGALRQLRWKRHEEHEKVLELCQPTSISVAPVER